MSPAEFFQDYNWREAFGYVGEPDTEARGHTVHALSRAAGATCSINPITCDDVAEIIAASAGERDEHSWIGVFRIRDGRYLFVSAWCDYTGWDCQAGGSGWVADDFEGLCQFAIDDDSAERLGIDRATATVRG